MIGISVRRAANQKFSNTLNTVDLLQLVSDNLPGVPGIGKVTADHLFESGQTWEEIIETSTKLPLPDSESPKDVRDY